MSATPLSRRTFLGQVARAGIAAAAAPMIVPRRVLGGPGYLAPSDTVNVAGIGIGGMGRVNLQNMPGQNIVALVDVDWDFAAPVFNTYPNAARYWDYRRMFDEMGDQIDGVVIATPDHTHALITLAAMERGIHVYTQKPLTWSIWEARQLGLAARRYPVVTQMGNQGRSSNLVRELTDHIRGGSIGNVSEVHVWTNRPIWPQGIDMPTVLKRKPEQLNWDLFLGPAAEMDYDPAFHPFAWRGWVPFGTGAMGDIAAHSMAFAYSAADMGAPATVETQSTSFNGMAYPSATTAKYEYPARAGKPPVTMYWYDGGMKPPRPEGLPAGEELSKGGGNMYVGDKGTIIQRGNDLRFLPDELDKNRPSVPQLSPRIEGESHEMNWIRAIRGEEETTSPFSFAAPLTETVLLAVVSLRAGNRQIHWDADNLRVTNIPEANEYLHREERKGWELPAVPPLVGSN